MLSNLKGIQLQLLRLDITLKIFASGEMIQGKAAYYLGH